MPDTNRLLVITGAPCSGKSTMGEKIIKEMECRRVKTCTTKSHILSNGYKNLTRDVFQIFKKEGKFVETIHLGGYMYGLQKSKLYHASVDKEHRHVLIISPDGARAAMEYIALHGIRLEVSCIILGVNAPVLMERLISKTLSRHVGSTCTQDTVIEVTDEISALLSNVNDFNHFRYYRELNNLKETGYIKMDNVSLLDNAYPEAGENIMYFASKFFRVEV